MTGTTDRPTVGRAGRRHAPARRLAVGLLAAGLLVGCTGAPSDEPTTPLPGTPTAPAPSPTPTPTAEPPALSQHGVSSGHPLASQAGLQMLEMGGTAVDAAVATAFADAVMQPASSGIGGGGAAIVVADGVATHLDYREVVNQEGVIPPGGAGVPGFVRGLAELHAEFGELEWDVLLEPAIEIAAQGGPVSRYLAGSINSDLGQAVTGDLPHFNRPDGTPLQEGDLLVQEDLARTMRVLAEEGPDALFTGSLAPLLTAVPGLDAPTLAGYETQRSEPPRGQVGEYTMLSGSPALPGAAIIQMVQIAEAAGIAEVDPASADFVELQSRAWRVADQSVQTWFGDPAFVDVPVEQLTDPAANAAIAATLDEVELASAEAAYEGAANTTHISVVDSEGMAVSMTNTITNYWGSGQYVGGFFMNDQLERFGDIGATTTNDPEPGRRSVTWSSPSMVLDDQDRPVLVVGTPGGRQIPNTTAQVVTLWALHDLPLEQAIAAERFMFTDGQMRLETDRLAAELQSRGYRTRVTFPEYRANYGSVQALEVDWETRTVHGVADTRRSAGFEIGSAEDRD